MKNKPYDLEALKNQPDEWLDEVKKELAKMLDIPPEFITLSIPRDPDEQSFAA